MRWLSLLIILSLCIPIHSVQSASAASPKQGAACSKLNLKATSGKYGYTCIKSGKKLVWSKSWLIPKKLNKPIVNSPQPTGKPVPMTKCYLLGAKFRSDQGIGLSCEKMQDGKLFWIDQNTLVTPMPTGIATPQPSDAPLTTPQQPSSKPSLLTGCNAIDQQVTPEQGIKLMCKKMPDGILVWDDYERLAT